jgi:bifunctional DNA-binding transcriptional regulator/antitoxin component of YhaV-PrlF toxin-antitoxin module
MSETDEKYELRVTSRGRVTLPKEFRDEVGSPSHFIAESDGGTITLVPAKIEPQTGE